VPYRKAKTKTTDYRLESIALSIIKLEVVIWEIWLLKT